MVGALLGLIVTSCQTAPANTAPAVDVAPNHHATQDEPIEISIAITDETPSSVFVTGSADDTTLILDGNLDVVVQSMAERYREAVLEGRR